MASSDSDDELMVPTFLQNESIASVLTPKKIFNHEYTLSPLTLTPPSCISKKRNHFSLLGLLSEKSNLVVKLEENEKIDQMRKSFEEDDLARLVDETENTECEDTNHSQEIENQTQNLNTHDKQILQKVTGFLENDFPEICPGDEIFIHQVNEESIQNLTPLFKYCDIDLVDLNNEILKDDGVATRLEIDVTTANDICDLLSFLTIDESTPDDVCHLLWRLVCLHKDKVVSESIYNLLISKVLKKNVWLPKVADFVDFLITLGADVFKLSFPPFVTNPFVTNLNLAKNLDDTEKCFIRKKFNERCFNLISIIRLYGYCVHNKLVKLCTDEIDGLLLVLLRCCLDKVLDLYRLDLINLIGSLLDFYVQWNKDQMVKLTTCIYAMNLHHHNILQLSDFIPMTLRGLQFKQLFCFLMSSSMITDGLWKQSDVECPVTPRLISKLIDQIHINEATNYYKLHSVILLLEASLYTDDVLSTQKISLSSIMNKLRSLNSDIKECRGHFIDRTKVKDVIIRFVSKIMFALQNLQTQCHLDSYFEKTSSNIIIVESVKQTANDEDETSE
ncbi:uncharacterized protein LOC101239367 isoform X1 [Hydra vulgaris]|uniref:uncharacterized protein LOC101239367 isoform X1 n=1 Tax=Hydra vulgaris TaxID=6087 RepID=UPI001F5EC4E1|nr:uncharacterized protein LOC101239367 isoform X1 [Hydra vulgaris]